MPRGRPRKTAAGYPAHIDPTKLPKGVFWSPSKVTAGKGAWWMFELNPDTKKARRKLIATETALLSELHAIVEADDLAAKGTVARVLQEFHASTEFKALAKGTRTGYEQQQRTINDWPTKLGIKFGLLQVDRLSPPIFQRLVESIAAGDPAKGIAPKPSKANHLLRYLRRAFAWGIRFDACKTNPAKGVKQATERKRVRMPEATTFARLLTFARDRGLRKPHTDGSVAPYLAGIMEIAYACRLRGIEVVTLTDAHATDEGIRSNRRKGSLDNITRWTPRLRAAWDELAASRTKIRERAKRPAILRPEHRFLVVSQSGDPLSKSSFDSAWQRLIAMATREGILTAEERFSLHGLKHRGVTDTKGTKADKREASGHKSEAAFHVYDHAVPTVDAAGDG